MSMRNLTLVIQHVDPECDLHPYCANNNIEHDEVSHRVEERERRGVERERERERGR